MTAFDTEEFLSLSNALEGYHGIFYKLWNLGQPVFSNKLPRAGVYFDKLGNCIEFVINPEFWKTQTFEQKLFIISHECLHVILNHGIRMKDATDKVAANIALDIVVNHSLIERFGFVRKEVDPNNEYCWTDTVLTGQEPIDKNFEYYYDLIDKSKSKDNKQTGNLVDDHNFEDYKDLLDKIADELSDKEKESLEKLVEKHCKEAGKTAGSNWITASFKKIRPKSKWETIIKKWAKKSIKDKYEEQWIKPDRRILFFDKNLILPTENEIDAIEKDKILVYFFQDTSGSCYSFAQRFFNAAQSLPPERFDVKLFCFDTQVYETNLKERKLYGFGGTSFSCIENFIQSYIKNKNVAYPRAVFCITDGLGNNVKPQIPENWYWFLSQNYKNYIPKESNIYMLSDFE